MKSRMLALGAALTALAAVAAPQAHAAGKKVAFLDGPIADKYIGAMTNSFTSTAKAAGLDVSVVQSPFDPALHEAVIHDTSAEVDVPTATTVLRQGYRRGDRVLRTAMVAVTDPEAAAPPAAPDETAVDAAAVDAAAPSPDAGDEPAAG